ncbi:hypothetical protein NX059_012440 [Plenodomus lindquistii]|nr:hypothetical protein NX059_012440 [Plenodomus lindquistii]
MALRRPNRSPSSPTESDEIAEDIEVRHAPDLRRPRCPPPPPNTPVLGPVGISQDLLNCHDLDRLDALPAPSN